MIPWKKISKDCPLLGEKQKPKNAFRATGLSLWLTSKESACIAGVVGSITGSSRSPGGGNGNPLQYSCLENPMDRGAWQVTVHGVTKSETCLKRLSIPETNSTFLILLLNLTPYV